MSLKYKIYFSDRSANRILAWDVENNDLQIVLQNELNQPYGLALDYNDNLLIADKFNQRICRFASGKIERISTYDPDGHRRCRFPHLSDNPVSPTGIFTEPNGNLLVAFSDDNTIYRVHKDGRLELVLGIPPSRHSRFNNCHEYVPPDKVKDTPIFMPTNVIEHANGAIYFIERGFQTVREYHPQRGLRCVFSSSQKELYSHAYPTSLVLLQDKLIGADLAKSCVWEYDIQTQEFKYILSPQQQKSKDNRGPIALAVSPDQTLWIWSTSDNTIQGWVKNISGWNKLPHSCSYTPQVNGCESIHGGSGMVCQVKKN